MFKVARRLRSRDQKKAESEIFQASGEESKNHINEDVLINPGNTCSTFVSLASRFLKGASPAQATVVMTANYDTGKKVRRVAFQSVYIREYTRALGDNPSCSSGAPIAIGWEYTGEKTIEINAYENLRGTRRSLYDLVLSRDERNELLVEWGVSINEIVEAIRTNIRIKHQRRRTVNAIGTYDRWEEAMETCTRRIRRSLRKPKEIQTRSFGGSSLKRSATYDDLTNATIPSRPPPSPRKGSRKGLEDTTAFFSDLSTTADSPANSNKESYSEDNNGTGKTITEERVDDPTQDIRVTDTRTFFLKQETLSTTDLPPVREILVPIDEMNPLSSALKQEQELSNKEAEYYPCCKYDSNDKEIDMYPSEIRICVRNESGDDGFESLRRNISHWEVGGVDAPTIERKLHSVVIHEDTLSHIQVPEVVHAFVQTEHTIDMVANCHYHWEDAGFMLPPPPYSNAMVAQWG